MPDERGRGVRAMTDRSRSDADRHRDPRALRHRTSRGGPPPESKDLTITDETAVPILSDPFTAHFRDLMEELPVAAFVKDLDGRYVYANPYLLATLGSQMGPDWHGKTDADMWPHVTAAMMRAHDKATLHGAGPQVFSRVMPLEDGIHTVLLVEFPLPGVDPAIGVCGIGVDVTEQSNTEGERDRLAAGIAQVAESIIITDREARITYVNRAFERATGYTRDEVIGQNPRLLKSGVQTPWFYDAMWAAITNGLPWAGDLVNRRKDGTLFTEEAVISPVRDSTGAITSYVAVQRDVTTERELEERSAQLRRERALIAQTIRGLRTGETPEATAQEICRQIVRFAGVMSAGLFLFGIDGHARPVGFVVQDQPDPPLRQLPLERSKQLWQRAIDGPWIEAWVNRPANPYNQISSHLGIHSVGCAPVRYDGRVIGLLLASAREGVEEVGIRESLPALAEFADLAGALIGRDVAERTELGRGRDHIADVIARRAFGPVFQPIVELASNRIVGYEALTRFTDGANPELVFAEGSAVGLGAEIETATLEAALGAAEALPQSAWLNLNASPEFILAVEPLHKLLAASRRHVVLEVTEHAAIADYPAFRTAMAALGPDVEFAVDDTGTGFASLRHIVELRPAFVKLDRSLIAGLESDEARQAMVVGLCHFAHVTGCRLIVEGIETESELTVLRALAIELGQGYLLGRPLPVDESGGPGSARTGAASRERPAPASARTPLSHAASPGTPARRRRGRL
jgi:PAS domain S-box-containing protein